MAFLLDLSNRVVQSRSKLDSMDAACGDGDFGSVMYLAFSNVRKTLEDTKTDDIGALLSAAGQSILSVAGGASGPMFGTLFIEAGYATKGKNEIGLSELALMFERSLQKIRGRGGADVGDKTLIDALEPAVDSLKRAVIEAISLPLALKQAAEAANSGSESTKLLVAKCGKARYLGIQTVGFIDPGAYVMALVFASLASIEELKA
jgi:dihydroxyacetone kinase-like protein